MVATTLTKWNQIKQELIAMYQIACDARKVEADTPCLKPNNRKRYLQPIW